MPQFPRLAALSLLCCAAVPLALAAPPLLGGCPVLPPDHVFNTRIDSLPVHPQSADYLATISTGTRRLHLDLGQSEDPQGSSYWGIPYNLVAGDRLDWARVHITADGAAGESDCARADGSLVRPCTGLAETARLPIPRAPLVEGGIRSDTAVYNDHHILALDTDRCMLWESYLSYLRPDGGWNIYSSAAFDLRSNALRPAGWTSADAAGFPILSLLLRADEASAGEIRHALRFTIQSSKIRAAYTWPARHLTRNGGTSPAKPAMGQLFRLKADHPIPANATVQARAILTALKRYGMYIADGGSDMFITGTPSRLWSDDTVRQVQAVPHSAFEAVDLAPVMARPGFDPDSARVPPAPGAPAAFSAAAEGPAGAHTVWATVQAAAADQGRPGLLFVVAHVPGTGLFALSPQGWVQAGPQALPALLQAPLATHLLPVLRNADLGGLRGTEIYAGYGTSVEGMLHNGTFARVHVVP